MEDARSVQVRKPEIPDPWPITGNVHPTYYIYVYVHTYYISIYTYIYIYTYILYKLIAWDISTQTPH